MRKKPETKRRKTRTGKSSTFSAKPGQLDSTLKIRDTKKQSSRLNKTELEELRACIADTQETLNAIRCGEVDALLVSKAGDEQVFTLKGADHAYRVLVEEMNEGAATLNPEGIILFCNNALASMLDMPLEKIIGSSLRSHIADGSLQSFDQFISRTLFESGKLEVKLQKENGVLVPALLSGRKLSLDNVTGISIVVTDISLQKQAQEILRSGRDELEKKFRERTSELRIHQAELEIQNEELRVAQEELEISRKKYADLYDLAPIGYFSLDSEGIIKEANFAGSELLGFDKYSLLETPFSLYIADSENRSVFSSHQKEAFASHFRASCEIRLRRNDSTLFYAQLQSIAVGNGPDKADYIRTAVVDMTDRRRMEEALRVSEARFRTLSHATFEGIAISENGYVIEANDQFSAMHGFSVGEVLGKHITDFVAPEDREDRMRAVRSGDERINEYRAIKKDGSAFFVEVHGKTIEEGARRLRVSAIRDVTDRKLVEEALHKNEERLREYVKLLEYAPVMVRNMNDEIILWNSGMARMYRYSAAEAIGRNCRDLLQTVFPQPPEQILEVLNRTGRWEGYLQHVTGDGRKIIVASLWVLHKNSEGKATAVIEVNSDITERRRAEEQLRRLNEELEARVRERTEDLAKTISTLEREMTDRKRAEEAVKAERQRFNEVLETLPAYLVLLTPDYHVAFANRFFRERFGGDPQGRRCFEYLFRRSEPCDVCETYKVLKTNAPHRWEWTGPDGRNYYIYDFPFMDTDGSTLVMEMGIDITEQKKAEQALRESKVNLAKAQSIAHIGSWTYDLQSEKVSWSDELYRIFNLDPLEFNVDWQQLINLVHEEDRKKVSNGIEQIVTASKVEPLECRINLPDGRKRVVWAVAETVCDREGKPVLILGTIQDITERKHAEEELTRLATAVESAGDALVVTDPVSGIIQYVNPAFEKMTGYAREEVVGRDLHLLESGRQDEEFFKKLREALRQDGVWTGRMVHKKKDGSLYNEECTYSAVKNPSGAIINYISIKRDVTEKVRLESIAQAVETMNNIGYIFSGVSHEIGNPINAIRMTLDIMQKKLDTLRKENIAEYLDRVMSQIFRVEYLLRGLKNFNMYESLQPAAISISSFLDGFLSMVKKDFEAKGILIETALQEDAVCVYADPRALQQVLLNILTNASDALHGREDPKIIIEISASAGLVKIRVRDNGQGIEENKLKDLFKPFYTTKEHGTGLGLVIIKKMIARMNGTVEITSRINEGTTVELCLPYEKAVTND